jgi:hypothetical protein
MYAQSIRRFNTELSDVSKIFLLSIFKTEIVNYVLYIVNLCILIRFGDIFLLHLQGRYCEVRIIFCLYIHTHIHTLVCVIPHLNDAFRGARAVTLPNINYSHIS